MATNNKIPKCPPLRFPEFNEQWQQTRLNKCLSCSSSSISEKQLGERGIPVFGASGIVGYALNAKPDQSAILIIKDGSGVGRVSYIDTPHSFIGTLNSLQAKTPDADLRYIYYYIHLVDFRKYVSGSGIPHIYFKDYGKEVLSLPSLAEQSKIAGFLSLIDERIQSCSETIKELKTQKAALLNRLFSQTLRFPEFNDQWTQTTLGAISKRVTRKNADNTTQRVLTISAQYGLIDQRDFFNKTVAGANLEGYYFLKKGEFAYNRSSSADYPWGAIKRLDDYNEGVLSTLYICFAIIRGDSDFLVHFFETSKWHNHIHSVSAEGARNHGLLNVAVNDFFSLPLSLPTLAEQSKIAGFLSLIDERIETEEELLQQYEKQKRYLLRQMFV